MRRFKIYLAGACRGLPDEGKIWRREVCEWFKEYNDYFPDPIIDVYDPTEFFARDGSNSISSKQVKNFYLNHIIFNSDIVLVNLNDTQYSCGTAQELQYAVDNKIPVIGFGKNNVFDWFIEDCDVVFDTQQEALDYIVNYYI